MNLDKDKIIKRVLFSINFMKSEIFNLSETIEILEKDLLEIKNE